MKKRDKQNKPVKAKTKQTNKNLGFLGNDITHARTGLCAHNQACVCRQDYAYTTPCPKDLKTQKESRNKNPNSNSQTCSEYARKYKPALNKQVITQTK